MLKKFKIPYLGVIPIVFLAAVIIKLVFATEISFQGVLSAIYDCVAYFIWGFAFAYLLNPAMVFFEKLIASRKDTPSVKHGKRAVIIAFLYLLLLGLLTIFIVAIVPTIRKGVSDLIDNIPRYASNFEIWLLDLTNSFDPEITESVEVYTKGLFETLYNWLTGVMDISFIGGAVTSAVSGSAQAVMRIFFGVVVSVYLLYSKEALILQAKKLTYSLFSEKRVESIFKTTQEINVIFQNFIVSKLLQSFIMFTIGLIVLVPLKIPLAPLIALIIAITNMIPYFGPWIGSVPCVLLALFIGGFWPAFITVLFAVGIQILDNLIIGPKIMSTQVGISPLLVIAGVTIGGKFGGIFGMFLGVPLIAVLKLVFYDRFISKKLREKNLQIS